MEVAVPNVQGIYAAIEATHNTCGSGNFRERFYPRGKADWQCLSNTSEPLERYQGVLEPAERLLALLDTVSVKSLHKSRSPCREFEVNVVPLCGPYPSRVGTGVMFGALHTMCRFCSSCNTLFIVPYSSKPGKLGEVEIRDLKERVRVQHALLQVSNLGVSLIAVVKIALSEPSTRGCESGSSRYDFPPYSPFDDDIVTLFPQHQNLESATPRLSLGANNVGCAIDCS
nr:hypothetical protein CFP56_67642 [Quercus suber]